MEITSANSQVRTPEHGTGPRPVQSLRQMTAATPRVLTDEQCLEGWDPALIARWIGRNEREAAARVWLQRELPPIKDDFVAVPYPLLAASDLKSPAISDAIKQYEKQAGVVDARLFRKVSLRLKAVSLGEFCRDLSSQTGVEFRADRGVADENVTVLVKDRPTREVIRQIARLFGFKWSRSGGEGAYKYELLQDLRAQLTEEEMRNRDLHKALVALDDKMSRYHPLLHLTPEQIRQRAAKATEGEKELLSGLAGKGWGAAQLYFHLSPAQRLTLVSGKSLTFSSNSQSQELRLPAELRAPVIRSTRFTLGTFEGARAIVEEGFGQPGVPLADRPDAVAKVTLTLGRSEFGQLSLHGHSDAGLEDESGLRKEFWAGDAKLSTATSPSVSKPENAAANAKLRAMPELRKLVTVKPIPTCVWFAPGPKPVDRAGFELENNGKTLTFGPNGEMQGESKPHVTSADVWDAFHEATGMPIIADSYSRVHDLDRVQAEKLPLFDALCRSSDEMGVRWQKDGEYLLARSTSFFWDKLKEPPSRLLRRWQADRKRGFLSLDDLLEMSTLSDAQLDSRVVGYVVGHCYGLEEWGIVGSGGAFRLGLPSGAYMRKYARFLTNLSEPQRERALGTGLAAADLDRAQQELLAGLLGGPGDLQGLRFQVHYAPVGTYIWHPTARTSTEAEALNATLPFVSAATAEAALDLARKHQPSVTPDHIKRSRGALCLSFENANRRWKVGAAGVAFSFGE